MQKLAEARVDGNWETHLEQEQNPKLRNKELNQGARTHQGAQLKLITDVNLNRRHESQETIKIMQEAINTQTRTPSTDMTRHKVNTEADNTTRTK